MKITVDDSQLKALARQLTQTGKVLGKRQLKPAVRIALKPVLEIARREVPKGKTRFRSTATRTTRSGKIKRDGTYDRGGALARSLRVLVVDGAGEEVIRGLVGASKRRGQAGWRAGFTTRGAVNRHTRQGFNRGSIRPNDFLDRAERQGTSLVISSLSESAQQLVRSALQPFL